jgi:transposase
MPTVVIDAGIATEENLNLIKSKRLNYICVDRRRVKDLPEEEPQVIYEKDDTVIKAVKVEESDEVFLYCVSDGRARKEGSIKEKFQSGFEEELSRLRASLGKKGGIKKYEKVIERIGRIKERYSRIAHFYDITVKEKDGEAVEIYWKIKDSKKLETNFSGAYCLRTSRRDLSEKELWSIYNMLIAVEGSFRSLKSELTIGSLYQRISKRIRGHVFTTLLAYHLLCVIQKSLHNQGICHSWETVRKFMRSHVRVTTTMTSRDNKTIYVRASSQPEEFHLEVYNALKIPPKSLQPIKRIR